GTGRHSKKIYKRALGRSHVRVHQDTYSLRSSKRAEETARKILLGKRLVAVKRAVAVHHGIQIRIVQGANHNVERMPLQRMDKGADLPSPKMPGQKDYSFAARLGLGKILKAVINGNFGNILEAIAGQEAKLRQLTAQAPVQPSKDLFFLLPALLRKSNLQVAHAYHPQAGVQEINRQPYAYAHSPGQGPRKTAQKFGQQPDRKIFKFVSHWPNRTVTLAEEYFKFIAP